MALKQPLTTIPNPIPPPTTVLELSFYKKYTWQGHTYEGGQPYRFRNEDAMLLLAEQDYGRQVWRVYRAPLNQRKQQAANEPPVIMDATGVSVPPVVDEWGIVSVPKDKRRIDVGNDDEIADILSQVATDEGGDVTV